MNEQQMKHIIAVAKCKSISKASKDLFITQQALSNSINSIEKTIGAKLFKRSANGTVLTDIGFMIVPIVDSLLSKHEESMKMIASIVDKQKLTITISYEHSYLPLFLPVDLTSRLGDIRIKSIIAYGVDRCVSDVESGNADVGFSHNSEIIDKSGLEFVQVVSEPMHILMSKDHALAVKDEITLDNLNGIDQLAPTAKGLPNQKYLQACIEEGFFPKYVFESDEMAILLRNVKANVGVLASSKHVLTGEYPDIIAKPLVHDTLRMKIGFVTKLDSDKKIRSFINAVRSCMED